jgi:hypothetical protein
MTISVLDSGHEMGVVDVHDLLTIFAKKATSQGQIK